MKIINLKEYGRSLSTRKFGKRLSNKINFSESENIILNFEDVYFVDSSFSDELIGKNVKKIGFKNFKKKVKIENATDNIKIIIKKSIMDRLLEN